MAAEAILAYYGAPAHLAHTPPAAGETVELDRDFLLFLYRQEFSLSWTELLTVPLWRVERDLAYLNLRGRAQTWARKEAERDARFEAAKARMRGGG